jgi:BTB/POZ domain-containing protein 9
MFINKTFNIDPDSTLLKPTENVASIGSGAIVIEGVSRSRNELINGNYDQYDWNQGYTCHQIGSAAIVIQFPQPYLVDSLRLLLWDIDDRCYSFDIDVSCDGQEWTQIIKAHELRSWVAMKFKMIPVVFIRITGTFNTANEIFHVVHFECPAKPGTVFKTDVQDEFPIIYGFQKLSLNESDRPDEKEVPSEDKIEE